MTPDARRTSVALDLVRRAGRLVLVCLWLGATVFAQERSSAPPGRRLDEALADLQRAGLKVIYSSEVVRPSMWVLQEPPLSSPRRVLDALLAPHGLIARNGPGGTVLVMKNPRARLVTPAMARAVTPVASAPPDAPRYAETIQVTDDPAAAASAGPAPAAIRGIEARDLAGGFDNIIQALTVLPGVTGIDELGGRFAVRGGAPDQNLTVMDGIEIHNPFRLVVPAEDLAPIGLASSFNPDTVDRVELHPGAFDVAYGDRLSSLLVVRNREGSQDEAFQGVLSMNVGSASLTAEGKLPRGADGSWLISARRSYLGFVLRPVTDMSLPSFTDVHVRTSWLPRPGRRLSLVVLAGRERLHPPTDAAADAGSATATDDALLGVTFESSVGRRGYWRSTASYSRFTGALDAFERSLDNSRGANTPESIAGGGLLQFTAGRRIGVADLALRQELTFVPSSRHRLDAGADVHDLDTSWAWSISGDRHLQQANGSSIRLGGSLPAHLESGRRSRRAGAWARDRWQVAPRLVLEPGLRLEYSTLTGVPAWSPRLGASAALGAWRLDGALRVHAQSPGYEKMLQSDYFVDLSENVSRSLKAERALQAVVGVQRTLPNGFTARVDTYYKRYTNLLAGRLETEAERTARLGTYDVPASLWPYVPSAAQITTTPANAGHGRAYGLEVHVSRLGGSSTPVTGWLTYSLGSARRTEYGVTRSFDYDRRHGLTAAAAVRMGPRWDVAATARAASGLPRTPVRGVRLSLAEDAADADADGNRTEVLPLLDSQGAALFQPDFGGVSNLNRARLPPFARLDVRLTYRPAWGAERWAFYGDIVNVLNNRNVTQIDSLLRIDPDADHPRIIEVEQDRGVPFFPSIGVRFWF